MVSIEVLNRCWPVQCKPPQKAVLIALADFADDAGCCWPSLASLVERTCMARSTVIEAVSGLEALGLVVCDRSEGRKTTYHITNNPSASRTGQSSESAASSASNPSASRTGEAVAAARIDDPDPSVTQTGTRPGAGPVREPDPSGIRTTTRPGAGPPPSGSRTGPVREPDPNHHRTTNEPPGEPPERANAPARAKAVARPNEVDADAWDAWLTVRRAKRAGAVTQVVIDAMRREAQAADITLAAIVRIAAERGWQSVRADWLQRDRGSPVHANRQTALEARNAAVAAAWLPPELREVKH